MPPSPPPGFAGAPARSRSELLDATWRAPRPSRLHAPLEAPTARAAKGLHALGLETVGDLLEHLPREHDDRRQARPVASLGPGETATLVVEVRSLRRRETRSRRVRVIVEATVADASGPVKALWFNQFRPLKELGPGAWVVLHGQARARNEFHVKEYERTRGPAVDGAHSTGLVPVYPASEGITAAALRELVWETRERLDDVVDPLPAAVRAREGLADRPSALRAVHFPTGEPAAAAARARLAFDELALLELTLLRRRARRRESARAPAFAPPGELTAAWRAQALPFAPTADQEAAMAAIDAELADEQPMQRLLMGEVGSGKTVVALYAMLRAVEQGAQAALMAPTETLAEQHFATLQALGPPSMLSCALLTGSTPARRRTDVLAKLGSGELGLVVGTHALIEEAVEFAGLALVVVDEQHRFGVRQRTALDRKGPGGLVPHVLHMTATPIPRTLALTAYGDLEVTALRELPRGRQPVATHLAATEAERARAYERMREELRAGRQAFVVCPLVAESEALEARAATVEFERLRDGELRGFRVALLHGQMRPRDKQAAMASFAAGEADVLVATTVIEVGIDVPNATVMLVEGAERYGISQLHQLRGRIGRGGHASLCLLFGPKESPRLQALAAHRDGFALAEIDLQLRGEGELVGVRQSGLAQFRVARLPEDAALLERARAWAQEVLLDDPELRRPEHALLAPALEAAHGAEALEPIPA